MIVFVDLETTGLKAGPNHTILEVAGIITDDQFNEKSAFHRVVYNHHAAEILNNDFPKHIDPYVISMHTKNGLWLACSQSKDRRYHVDEEFAAWIKTYCQETGERNGPQLAGNTINFDRNFLEVDFPESFALLHYRNIDITTLNEMARRFFPNAYASRPRRAEASHRAMDDILESLDTARHYSKLLKEVDNAA